LDSQNLSLFLLENLLFEGQSEYLKKKGVKNYGLKYGEDGKGNFIAAPYYNIQGELCGPGIQGNRMGFEKLTLCWYNVYHIGAGIYMPHQTLFEFCLSTGLTWCEVVFQGKMYPDATVKTLLDMANEMKYKNGLPAEGIVWRPTVEQRSEALGARMSFKTISNVFLEKYKE
jgi:hypothetical protein